MQPISATNDSLGAVFTSLWRQRRLLIGCVVIAVCCGISYAMLAAPVYEAVSSVRIEDQEANLPDVIKQLSTESRVSTEVEVLRSAALARAVVAATGLRVELQEPRLAVRTSLVSGIVTDSSLKSGTIDISSRSNGTYSVRNLNDGAVEGVRLGDEVRLPGIKFVLASGARRYNRILLRVVTPDKAVTSLKGGLSIDRTAHDANIIAIRYRNSDPTLAAAVPNELLDRFISERQNSRQVQARNTVTFLRQQIDTVSQQLLTAENQLLAFRNRGDVISLPTEASSQVNRLVGMEADRTRLETERSSLAQLVKETSQAPAAGPGQPSPYRRLMAFPGLIGNAAVSELLRSLAQLEDQRAQLLIRRTTRDPDVQVLDARISDADTQLKVMAITYLAGLTNREASLDSSLKADNRALAVIPAKEIDLARLERSPKVLEDIYTLLQTKLQEASIAAAAGDPSVQIVDMATRPTKAAWPKTALIIAACSAIGLLIGIIIALVRDAKDKCVHSRADLLRITGIPVLGLVPNLNSRRLAWISRRHKDTKQAIAPGTLTWAGGRILGTGAGSTSVAATDPYDRLYLIVTSSLAESGPKALVVTSPLPGDGKTTTATNLALTLARQGLRVLLIDADVRRGQIRSTLGAPKGPGLTDVLRANTDGRAAVNGVDVGNGRMLYCLSMGSPEEHPARLLGSQQMRELLSCLKKQFDEVIIDSPPINVLTDAAALASVADATLVVARSGVTEESALRYAMEQLRASGATVIGTLLNDINPDRDAVYDAAYQYLDHSRYYEGLAT